MTALIATFSTVAGARFGGTSYTWRGRITRTEGEIDPRTRMVVAVAIDSAGGSLLVTKT